jgi:hypothetical protein
MLLYLRCVWANKATLVGYLLLVGGMLLLGAQIHGFAPPKNLSGGDMLLVGGILLFITDAGARTVKICKSALLNIRKYGERYAVTRIPNEEYYCDRVGAKLALQLWRNEQKAKNPQMS